jgi:hypothetical protein
MHVLLKTSINTIARTLQTKKRGDYHNKDSKHIGVVEYDLKISNCQDPKHIVIFKLLGI